MSASIFSQVSAELIPPTYFSIRWHPMCIIGLLLEQCDRSKPGTGGFLTEFSEISHTKEWLCR